MRFFILMMFLISLFTIAIADLSDQPPHVNDNRRIGWWWDAPATASDPSVDAFINFVKNHTNIVSSVLMRCGPSTLSGSISGDLLPSCVKVIPVLTSLGVESELWLGETDSVNAAIELFGNPDAAISALIKLGENNPGVKGFNFDFEVQSAIMCGSQRCDQAYSEFLGTLVKGLGSKYPNRWRVTTDASCVTKGGWAPIISNCSLLTSGADKVMQMSTYNAKSYQEWFYRLTPAVADDIPLEKMGIGLGCWVNEATNNTWSVTAKSAQERVCMLMNLSVTEIDMFRIAPEYNWPEPFWIPELEKFMNGGGCDAPIPPKPNCPEHDDGWQTCLNCPAPGCCTVSYADVDMDLCSNVTNHEACAKQQCVTSETNVNTWIPLNYSHFPYTCCPKSI